MTASVGFVLSRNVPFHCLRVNSHVLMDRYKCRLWQKVFQQAIGVLSSSLVPLPKMLWRVQDDKLPQINKEAQAKSLALLGNGLPPASSS